RLRQQHRHAVAGSDARAAQGSGKAVRRLPERTVGHGFNSAARQPVDDRRALGGADSPFVADIDPDVVARRDLPTKFLVAPEVGGGRRTCVQLPNSAVRLPTMSEPRSPIVFAIGGRTGPASTMATRGGSGSPATTIAQ